MENNKLETFCFRCLLLFLLLLRSFFCHLNALQTLFYWIIERNAQKESERRRTRAHTPKRVSLLGFQVWEIPFLRTFRRISFSSFGLFSTLHVEIKWRAFSLFPRTWRCSGRLRGVLVCCTETKKIMIFLFILFSFFGYKWTWQDWPR